MAVRSNKKGRFSYYEEKLSAERLKKAYTIAPPRVKQYLEAEVSSTLTLGSDHGYFIIIS